MSPRMGNAAWTGSGERTSESSKDELRPEDWSEGVEGARHAADSAGEGAASTRDRLIRSCPSSLEESVAYSASSL